jgi:hypothetical protein
LYDGRNKTFFMGAFEGVRAETTSSPFLDLPTERMWRGDFSEAGRTIRNPFTGQPFPNNQIPQSMLSPVSLKLQQYYPLPTLGGTADNYQGPAVDDDRTDQLLFRGDQNIGNNVRLSGRFNWSKDDETLSASPLEIQNVYQPRVNKNYLFSYTHTLGTRYHNDFRIGYHTINFDTLNYFWVNGVSGAGRDLGIPGFDDTQYGNNGLPSISISTFTGLGSGGTNWFQFDKTFQLSDVLSHTRGNHNIRAGVDMRKLQTGRRAQNSARGSFTFNGDMTGYSFADFMLGLPRTIVTPADQLQGHVGQWRNGFFINDVWQATPKMTLSLGLRYELNTPGQTYAGYATMLDSDLNTIIPTTLPSPGFEFHEPNYDEIAPRLGATYRLTEKTILRGGWGIYFNPNQMNTFTFLTNNPPLAAQYNFTNETTNPTLSFSNPSGTVGPAGPPNMITPNRDLPSARKNQWSFDIQQELFPATVLEVQYLASRTKNLDRSHYPNTPQPGPGAVDPRRPNQNFRQIRVIQNDLIANYDSLAFVLRRRMTKGFQANVHYTWSKTRDMANHSNSGGRIVNTYDIWSDYGPAAWDIPHRFVLSYMWEIPFLRESPNKILRSLLGGWQVSGVSTIQSGTPLNVTIQGDRANTGDSPSQRPDIIGDPSLNCQDNPSGPGLVNCFDPADFAIPAQYTFGNAPRNMLRGFSDKTTDLSLMKGFEIGPTDLQIRVEVFNLFNTVNWGSPNTTLGSASFGRVTSAGAMRRMQLGAKLVF